MIGETIKQYKILDQIGAGGMGVVYLAHDTDLDCKVVLKFLPPELTRSEKAKTRFRIEAQSAAALQHPHICTIHAMGETETGAFYICMPYYDGHSLKEYMSERTLEVREVYEIASSVADGLAAAHSHDPVIIHRDIKPANIMITKTGYVVIVDFGLAKLLGQTKVTMTGVTPGTAAYMSPEQIQGRELDARTDIWSLGVVIYEALTGKMPFRADLEQALFYQIVSDDPTPVRDHRPDVPEAFAAIVDKCLAKDPNDRFASMDDLLVAMHQVALKLKWQSSTNVRPVLRLRTWEEQRRRRLRWVLGVGAAVILLVAAFFYIPRPDGESPFVTDVRLAVLPLENLASNNVSDEFVLGLSAWLGEAVDRIRVYHESMWVIPYSYTEPGRVPTMADAKDLYGVNLLVTGSVQLFGSRHRVSVDLLDASSLQPLQSINVDFDLDSFADVPARLAEEMLRLLDIEPSEAMVEDVSSGSSDVSEAIVALVEAMGYLQRQQSAGSLDRAQALIEQALALDEEIPLGKAVAASVLWRQATKNANKTELRIQIVENLRHEAANSSAPAYVKLTLASMTASLKNHEEAIEIARKVLANDPANWRALRRSAISYRSLQRYDEAELVYQSMIDHNPDLYDGHRLFGYYFDKLGRLDRAEPYYRKTLDLAPKDSFTLKRLGLVLHTNGEWAEARKYYLQSFAITPDCNTCTNIGQLFYIERMFEEAARYYEFAMSYCDSTDATYYTRWNNWAEALFWWEGHRDEAFPKYRRAIELAEAQLAEKPEDVELLAYLATLYASVGENAKSHEFIDSVVPRINQDEWIMMLLAWAYEKMQNREQALRYIFDAVRLGYPVKDIEIEPLFSELRTDVRFTQFVEGIQKASNEEHSSD